jgi:hypothetical protein
MEIESRQKHKTLALALHKLALDDRAEKVQSVSGAAHGGGGGGQRRATYSRIMENLSLETNRLAKGSLSSSVATPIHTHFACKLSHFACWLQCTFCHFELTSWILGFHRMHHDIVPWFCFCVGLKGVDRAVLVLLTHHYVWRVAHQHDAFWLDDAMTSNDGW